MADLVINGNGVFDEDIEKVPRMYTNSLVQYALSPETDAFYRQHALEELANRQRLGEDIYKGYERLRPEDPWYKKAGDYLSEVGLDIMGAGGVIDNVTGNTGYNHLANITSVAVPAFNKYNEYRDRLFYNPNVSRINIAKPQTNDSRLFEWNYSQRENQSPVFDEKNVERENDDLYAKFKTKLEK